MKKNVYFALGAFLMVGCTSQETIEMAESSKGNAINFETFVNNATRGDDLTSANLGSFYVYGGYETDLVFENVKVTKSSSDWVYDEIQYWVPSQTYRFAAVAPELSNATFNYTYNKLTATGYSAGEDDLIVAMESVTAKASGENNQEVNLNFQHALSKVKFTFTTDMEGATVTVSYINLNNVAQTGDLTVTDNSSLEVKWENTNSTSNYVYSLSDQNGNIGTGSKYLIPQSTSEMTLTFKVSVSGYKGQPAVDNKEFTVSLNSDSSATTWENGNVYSYKIAINASNIYNLEPIKFGVDVTEWGPDSEENLQPTPSEP